MPRDDDLGATFEALMREQGVTPLGGDSPDAPATLTALARPTAPPEPPPAPTSPAVDPAALDALHRERDRATAEVRALTAARDAALDGIDSLRAALEQAEAARDAYDAERRTLARYLQQARDRADDRPGPLDVPALLAARGLPVSTHAEALAGLLQVRPDATLQALDGCDEGTLRGLLDQGVVATCGEGPCGDLGDLAVPVLVEAAGCEICGGRQGGAAMARLVAACAAQGIGRIVVVGGSPNSRRALRTLADGVDLRIDTVDGASKPHARKVKRLGRTTDLVVIWAGTILDHATSEAFEALERPTEIIPVRGLERMLTTLAERLEGDTAPS